jgi:hypothetical protein
MSIYGNNERVWTPLRWKAETTERLTRSINELKEHYSDIELAKREAGERGREARRG